MHTPLSPPRRALLNHVKRHKVTTIDCAVELLGLSKNATRAHIMRMEKEGLLTRIPSLSTPHRGRPQVSFGLGPNAHDHFPSLEGSLLVDLVVYLQDHNQDVLLKSYFQDLWERKFRELEEFAGAPMSSMALKERLDTLEEFLSYNAFMPSIRIQPAQNTSDTNTITIQEHHCPFFDVVKHTRLLCALEAKFLGRVLGTSVSKTRFARTRTCSCSFVFDMDAPQHSTD